MNNQKVNGYSLCAWIFCAVSAPLAMTAAGCSWITTALTGLVCGIICWCIHAFSDGRCWEQNWLCAVQFVWTGIAAGVIAQWSAECWPTENSAPAVPLVLLALALWSVLDGAERASRVGGVLLFLIAGIYAVVMLAGIKDMQPKWMLPPWDGENERLVFILLVPIAAAMLPRENKGVLWLTLLANSLFGTVISFVVISVLSPQASAMSNPFYEYSRSLSLLGIAERFEAVVSVVLTMGYYCIMSLLLGSARYLADALYTGRGKRGVCLCALVAAVLVVLKVQIPEVWLSILAIAIWGVFPIFVQGVQNAKNTKK